MKDRMYAGSYEAGGLVFTVETNRCDFAALVGEVLCDLEAAHGGGPPVVFEVLYRETSSPLHPWAVWRDGEPRAMAVADDYVMIYLVWEISRLMFDRTGGRVHLHGAAVVRNDRAVVLAGRSHAGKSTLAAWLTHRGWGFLTDEAALVDPENLIVSPFWRPICIRRPGPLDAIVAASASEGPPGAELLVPASTIGALAPPAPLAAIAFPSLTPNEPAALTPLSPADALVELTQHFPGLIADGRDGFRRLARLIKGVPAYVLGFHDLDDAERALKALVMNSA